MKAKLSILQHALGLNQFGQGTQYRNHFVTGPGCHDYEVCMALVMEGLMTVRKGNELSGGEPIFFATAKGIDFVALNSPVPPTTPKLTRGQIRYQKYREFSECYDSFAEFLGIDVNKRKRKHRATSNS